LWELCAGVRETKSSPWYSEVGLSSLQNALTTSRYGLGGILPGSLLFLCFSFKGGGSPSFLKGLFRVELLTGKGEEYFPS